MAAERFNILHVTDLHVSGHKRELLRKGHYEEYIRNLLDCMDTEIRQSIRCIVATGDFVNRGIVEQFGHAERVIEHLASKFALKPKNVAVCTGNHDILREVDKERKHAQAREVYKGFARKFANGTSLIGETRCSVLCQPCKGAKCLMLDSTYGSRGEECAGRMSEGEQDRIFKLVESNVGPQELLIVGTHHVTEDFPQLVNPFGDDDDPDWHKKHLWKRGGRLKRRIIDWRKPLCTLWLCGDVHSPAHITFKEENVHFVTTGRFGAAVGRRDSALPRR